MPYVHIDLREFDTSDMIIELEDRYLDSRDQVNLLQLIKSDDSIKLQLFITVMDRFSVKELEEMFKEDFSTTVTDTQLSLDL